MRKYAQVPGMPPLQMPGQPAGSPQAGPPPVAMPPQPGPQPPMMPPQAGPQPPMMPPQAGPGPSPMNAPQGPPPPEMGGRPREEEIPPAVLARIKLIQAAKALQRSQDDTMHGLTADNLAMGKLASAGPPSVSARLMQHLFPMEERRDLDPDELSQIRAAKKKWMRQYPWDVGDPITAGMASPWKQGLMGGGIGATAGGILGAGIGQYLGHTGTVAGTGALLLI